MKERRPMTPARIQTWDRRRAAIHEAGHVAVAAYYGCELAAYINRNAGVEPSDSNTWGGQAGLVDSYGKPLRGAFEIGVAGVLAELRYSSEDYDADDPDFCWQVLGNMSPSDRALAGIGDTCEDYDDPAYWEVPERAGPVYELVCRLWPEIWATSRKLIDESKERREEWRRQGV